MRWLEDDGHVSVFRTPTNNGNGNTFDFQGRQVTCEHLTRRVVRYELDGSVTVIADNYNGRVREVSSGTINTVAGGGTSLSDGSAPSAQLTPYSIAVDSAGDAYVTGSTASSNFPLASAIQMICGIASAKV